MSVPVVRGAPPVVAVTVELTPRVDIYCDDDQPNPPVLIIHSPACEVLLTLSARGAEVAADHVALADRLAVAVQQWRRDVIRLYAARGRAPRLPDA